MAKYFKKSEFLYSTTALKHKIDNKPQTQDVENNINELMEFLDDVRVKWGSAILVTSGYRCPQLNELVGGVKTSGHQIGSAADLVPANNKKREFYNFMIEYLKDKEFDELLLEGNGKGSIWVHFSLKSYQGKQRKKIKELGVK